MKMPKEVWRIDPQQSMAAVCKDAQEQIFWPAYDCVFQFDVLLPLIKIKSKARMQTKSK